MMEAMRGFLIVQELMTGQRYGNDNYDYGFYLVAQRKAAQRRGIDASNTEVRELILACGAFQKNGKFDYGTYTKVVASLRQRGMDGDFIAGAFRDEVIRTKLAREIAEAPDGIDYRVIPDFSEAAETALSLAQPGDTVLLSPACTSYDAFRDFAERGDLFRALCRAAR